LLVPKTPARHRADSRVEADDAAGPASYTAPVNSMARLCRVFANDISISQRGGGGVKVLAAIPELAELPRLRN